MRTLEKISFEQFNKDIIGDINLYNSYLTPSRGTKNSAGYDFKALQKIIIHPGEIKKIPTGIKACMNNDEVFLLFVRSSMGFKYNVRMCNQVGVIDSDYYNNVDNEGHIFVALKNEGYEDYIIEKNDAFVQGIFIKFLSVDDEKNIEKQRTGGFGSTSEEG